MDAAHLAELKRTGIVVVQVCNRIICNGKQSVGSVVDPLHGNERGDVDRIALIDTVGCDCASDGIAGDRRPIGCRTDTDRIDQCAKTRCRIGNGDRSDGIIQEIKTSAESVDRPDCVIACAGHQNGPGSRAAADRISSYKCRIGTGDRDTCKCTCSARTVSGEIDIPDRIVLHGEYTIVANYLRINLRII